MPGTIPRMPLPPQDPELNPVGNVRASLRASRPAISVCETCQDIVARCCNAWNVFASGIATLRPMTARDSARAVNV
ncbi:MAG: hypothetical protein IOC98_13515 [Rhodobacter sp.]|nr:hypothetical protein [Rhodobacter sp.]MCA3493351.1 hypothetical protein [Rhodobacter sp.]MCA3501021.1 hypothetical protein [Rhodobacter sp.]MCA3517980.1 hypothetical protein [Rhodobacter sp.]